MANNLQEISILYGSASVVMMIAGSVLMLRFEYLSTTLGQIGLTFIATGLLGLLFCLGVFLHHVYKKSKELAQVTLLENKI